jgi:glycosyltransferase involved in cell wall biosynthesis
MTSGGKERRLTELLKFLDHQPGNVSEIIIMRQDVHYREIFSLGATIHYVTRRNKRSLTPFFLYYKIFRNAKPHIVHCWDSMTATFAIPACKLLGIKLVNSLIVDAPVFQHWYDKYYLRARFSFLFSDRIIANSIAGIRSYKAPVTKSQVIYNGFDFNRINGCSKEHDIRKQYGITTTFIVGMVASFSRFKDYHNYYSAAQLLLEVRKDITFLAVGKNTDSEQSQAYIPDKYKANFRLLGEKSNIESITSAMDICVLSTFTEGISNAILEYMALEKPVIATIGGGTNEIIEDNVSGFLVSTSNPEIIANKIMLLLKDEGLRKRMGEAGKHKVIASFSINQMVNQFDAVYRDLSR